MRRLLALLMAFSALATVPAVGQRPRQPPSQPRAPKEPPKRAKPDAKPEVERPRQGRPDDTPHVRGNRWYGHATPGDPRFHLDRPFEQGRFAGIGRGHRYLVERIDRDAHRIWFPGGSFFEIAPWDWPLVADWCWTCGDDFIVYDDPDHVGWYLLFDRRSGRYVHVRYLGR